MGDDDELVKKRVKEGCFQLVYFTPEVIAKKKWRKMICSEEYQRRMKGLEAHTINTYTHRTPYSTLIHMLSAPP